MKCNSGKFSLLEQIWMQLSFNSIWILGFVAIWRANPFIALAYFVFVCVGIFFFMMHTWLCPNCPHIKTHNSCVQLHPVFTKWLIKNSESRKMKLYEKIGFFVVLYGIFLIPVYWVIRQPVILIVIYFIFVLMHYPAYFIWFCRKCLNVSCPQNMNKSDM